MLKLTSTYLRPCKSCVLKWIFPLQSASSQRTCYVTFDNVNKNRYGMNKTCLSRCHSTESEAKPQKDHNGSDVSLQNAVCKSREGCREEAVANTDQDQHQVYNVQDVQSDSSSNKSRKKKKTVFPYPWIKPEGVNTGVKLYNSLTKEKEPLILTNGRTLSW